ncbi:hypothetical protein HK096_010141, partial [Nowakowskiella sp. JEL0078]
MGNSKQKEVGPQSAEFIWKSFVAGGIAGSAAKTIIAPLDRVKILFQTSNPHFEKYSDVSKLLVTNREAAAIKAAQETISSLQDQIYKKGSLLQKYQNMLSDTRAEMTKQKLIDRREIERLTESLNTLGDKLVDKVKNPQEQMCNNEEVPDPTVFEKFEKIILIKDKDIKALKQSLEETKVKTESQCTELLQDVKNLEDQVRLKQEQLNEKDLEIHRLENELADTKQELNNAPPVSLHDDIYYLKTELAKKNSKQDNMKKAIIELKSALLQNSIQPSDEHDG